MTELFLRGYDGALGRGCGGALFARGWRLGMGRGLGAVLGEIPATGRGYDGSRGAGVAELWGAGVAELFCAGVAGGWSGARGLSGLR